MGKGENDFHTWKWCGEFRGELSVQDESYPWKLSEGSKMSLFNNCFLVQRPSEEETQF